MPPDLHFYKQHVIGEIGSRRSARRGRINFHTALEAGRNHLMGVRTGPVLGLAAAVAVAVGLSLALMTQWGVPSFLKSGASQDGVQTAQGGADPPDQPAVKLGLSINEPGAFQGYTLVAPVKSTRTYLIDMEGKVVRTWQSDSTPALGASLLENGHLLRAELLPEAPGTDGPGAGGRVREFTWEGDLVWDFKLTSTNQLPHHDITRLPNGNVLMIVCDRKTIKEAIAAGRRPDLVDSRLLLLDCLIEVKPTGKTTGDVVWEWHLWDHLVQDHDPSRPNFGNVAEHPELMDFNYYANPVGVIARQPGGMDKLRSLGYVGSGTPANLPRINPDWSHLNSVAYNPELDQIAVISLPFNELWIIDHSTTRAEAAGHKGGRGGKGGDFLYRWGNPRTHRAGSGEDQRLFAAHSAHWIPPGLPGAGHLLVFNNGSGRPGGNYSSVEELALPVDESGRYARPSASGYGPAQVVWSYTAPKKSDFYSMLLSGAQRLPNGNTLICSGSNGTLLEVTPEKEVVWKYINPTRGGYGPPRPKQGGDGQFGPAGGGSLFRAYRYGRGYAGLTGKDPTPCNTTDDT